MTEETESTNPGEPQVTETTESLDDVISQYHVPAPQAPAQSSQPSQPQPQQTSSASQSVPKFDPLDENSVNQFANFVAQNNSALSSQMQELSHKLTQYEQEKAQVQIETDIKSAVDMVNDGLSLNPKLVRTHLELTAQEKPAFKSIWENRANDPQTYNRALKALQKEIADTYQVRQDPELTETQTAIKQSQRAMASRTQTSQENPMEEALKNAKTDSEFRQIWDQMLG